MKKKIYLFFLLLFFLPISYVFADTNVEFNCLDEAMVGNTISCKVKINSDTKIFGMLARYEYDEAFTYSKSILESNSVELVDNSEGFTIVDANGLDTNSLIKELNLIISNDAVPGTNYDVKLKEIELSDGEKDIGIEDKVSSVKVLSINDVLEYLKVNDQDLLLSDGVNNYTFTVDNTTTSAEISAKLLSDKYSFSETNAPTVINDLKIGDNIVNLEILKDDLVLIKYTINIKRLEPNVKDIDDVGIENPKTGEIAMIITSLVLVITFVLIIAFKNKAKGSAN